MTEPEKPGDTGTNFVRSFVDAFAKHLEAEEAKNKVAGEALQAAITPAIEALGKHMPDNVGFVVIAVASTEDDGRPTLNLCSNLKRGEAVLSVLGLAASQMRLQIATGDVDDG